MSSIIIASVPVHGHVTPLLAVARNFVDRGDDVRFLTGARFAEQVTATGATHIPLPADADYDETVLSTFPQRVKLKGAKAIAFDVEHIFATPAKSQYHAVLEAHRQRPADAVLTDPAFYGAALLTSHPRCDRPAFVLCGVLPLGFQSRDTAPFGMGLSPARRLNRQRNAALTVLARRVVDGANRKLDGFHREMHGTGLPSHLLNWGRHFDAIVQFTVEAFEYPRSDAPAQLHFAGPLSASGSAAPLPAWWDELDGTRPVVHVTQGTVANIDYRQLIGPTVRALADEDVSVVVSTGGRPVDSLPPLPANARAAAFLPYDELLPRTDVYVTNGGYGGVQYALRYGVPIVATGGKEDKPEVGARVAWSGVGRRIRSEYPQPAALRGAILDVLNSPRYRQASQRIAADMAVAPGFSKLAEVVDGLVGAGARES
ncbi:glycosyltransferase [Mycobacterium sp. EPa45]|uniref:glycosyltransferase n=1 Tax=Mycobacterium sp. EPa45 TaxID=1545728 RepID=UPI000641DCB8|nr:nucleotide disphospho-sugar-binding domain-containing protein [Mycobacterium sp. EPa45]AKK27181.1 glycosyl transferase [Mycobacterium sp. EPa45]